MSDPLTAEQRKYVNAEKAKLRDAVKDSTNPAEIRELLAETVAGPTDDAHPFVNSATGEPMTFKLKRRRDAPPLGAEWDALAVFRESARSLKAAEIAFRDAQQAYAEAVKRLSEEAVK